MKSDRSKILSEAYGRVPPQAVDIEKIILGSLLIDKDSIFTAIQHIIPEAFYNESHQKISEHRFLSKSCHNE